MEFELKKVESTGDVQSVDAQTSLQWLNITAGVKGNPYNMVESSTVKYEFSNNLTVQQAKEGVLYFAESWVATKYPTITI